MEVKKKNNLFLYLGDMENFEKLTFRERPLITEKWHMHPIGVFNSLTTHGISLYIYILYFKLVLRETEQV